MMDRNTKQILIGIAIVFLIILVIVLKNTLHVRTTEYRIHNGYLYKNGQKASPKDLKLIEQAIKKMENDRSK